MGEAISINDVIHAKVLIHAEGIAKRDKENREGSSDSGLDLCVSSMRMGPANLLCTVPILTDDLRRAFKHSDFQPFEFEHQETKNLQGGFPIHSPKYQNTTLP